LDESTFRVPQASHPEATSVEVSERELDALLDGIDVIRRPGKAVESACTEKRARTRAKVVERRDRAARRTSCSAA
jgi:pyruvate/2-oxoglutarate dehydrogenase complex dihydrolipoamide dehydrogenase (E3) component